MKGVKKSVLIFILLVLCPCIFADDFTDAVQDLGMYAACIGTYSSTEAGGGWNDDPHDYYTPQDMASRLAKESGSQTKTNTFYGVCFNYAEAAFEYVNRYVAWYQSQGMFERQFWIAGVQQNPNQIELMVIGTKNDYSRMQNGVPVKTYPTSLRDVKTHDGATSHAWIWIEREDGVWFWVDPTWTDNLGYVVYGYVNQNAEEIQCRPDRNYCKRFPDTLENLPLPPVMGPKQVPSQTANSTNREETIKDANVVTKKKISDSWFGEYYGVVLYADIPFSIFEGDGFKADNMGYSIDLTSLSRYLSMTIGLEYFINLQDDNNLHSLVLKSDFMNPINQNLSWYWGGGLGLRFDFSNDWWKPKTNPFLGWLAWEVDAGIVCRLSYFFLKFGSSYNNIIGFSTSVGLGLVLFWY